MGIKDLEKANKRNRQMKRSIVNVLFAMLVAAFSFSLMPAAPARAAAYTASVTGNWSDSATWGGAGVPGSAGEGDTVVINTGITVTLDTTPAYSIDSLTLNAPAANNALNWSGTQTLIVTGNVTMNSPSAGTVNSTISVGTGTLNAGNIIIPGSATASRFCTVSVSTGTINVTGSITFSGTAAQARLTFTDAGSLNVGGNFGSGGTLTSSTGTINFNGGVAQTIGTYTTYKNIEINNTSGGVTLLGTTTFGGNLNVTSGTFTVGAFTLTVTGNTSISGTLTISSGTGTKTFGNITINNGGTMSFTAAEAVTMNGNLQNDGTLSGTTGTWTFQKAGGGGTISGSNSITLATATFTTAYTNSGTFTVTGTLTVTGIILINDNTITATGALSGTGNFTNSATGTLNIGGTSTITTLTATASGNIVKYTGAAQTVKATTYDNLTTSGSSTKTLGGAITVNGELTVGSGTTLALSTFTADRATAGGTITVAGTLNIGGTNSFPNNYTTHTLTGGTVTYSGTNQTVSAETYNYLSTSGSGNKTLAGATTVNGNLSIGTGTTLDVSGSNFALDVSGNWTNSGTFSPQSGTVTLNGSAAQTIGATTFYNLTTSTGGTKTLSGNVIVGGDLTVGSGTGFTIGAFTSNVTGTTSISGTLTISSTTGTKTFGNITINSGGTMSFTAAETATINGNLQNDGTISGTTGTWTFQKSGGGGTISGDNSITVAAATFTTAYTNSGNFTVTGTLTVTGVTLTNDGTITAASALSGTGGLTNSATGTLNIGNASAITTLTATADGNTVNYTRAGTQTAKVTTYSNLTLAGSSAKTFATTPTVNGILSMEGTATITVTTGVVTYGASATLQYNTASARTASAEEWVTPFAATGGVIISNTGAITLNAAKVFNASVPLTIESGATLSASSFQLTIGDDFINNGGTFTAGTGTVVYNGAAQTISPLTYNNLTINQASGNSTLGADATVNGILTLTSGNLNVTDPYVLTMGSAATTVGATDVTGIVKRTTLVSATSYTFGSQYTTVTLQNVGTLPTDMSIKISIGSAPAWKTDAIQRIYDVIQTGASSDSVATLQLHYLDSQLNGNTESTLDMYHRHISMGETEEHGMSSLDTTNNWAALSNLSTIVFSSTFGDFYWTLANSAATNKIWEGDFDTSWTNPANWLGGTPGATDNVTIATVINNPTLPADNTTLNTLTLNPGTVLNSGASSNLTIAGGSGAWMNMGGTFNPSTGTVTFTGAAATISGTNDFYDLTINPGANVTMQSSAYTRIGGTITNNGVWDTGDLWYSTVEYNGDSQTVLNPNGATPGYHWLVLSGSGTKTMPDTALTLHDDLTMSGTVSVTAEAAITMRGGLFIGSDASFTTGAFTHTIGGAFSNNGTFTATAGSTITFNGTSAQAITGATAFNNLTLNNVAGITINNDQTIGGTLTLTSGNVTTGSNTIIISSGGSVSRTSGFVAGYLQKYVTTGSPSITFEVGANASYDPVTVAFGSVTVAGNLIAKVTYGEHADIGSSTINSSKDVNDYWTLTNSGIEFDSYSATFNFDADDVDGSANTSNFIMGRYSSGWTYPTVGTRTSTSTQATGLTSFGDFAVGEMAITWVSYNDAARTIADDNFTTGENTVFMFGQGYLISHTYAVGYYDGSATGGGQKVASDTGLLSGTSGNLSSQYLLTTDFNAIPGTWHAVVFDPASGNISANYAAALTSPGYVTDDNFEVEATAIPEFTTVIAAIVVAGSCFGLYFWMRRRVSGVSRVRGVEL